MNKFTDPDDAPCLKAGQKVKCIRRQGYFMGQGGEAIRKGQTRIVEALDTDGIRLFFREDPCRYGPWDPTAFVLVDEKLTKDEIIERVGQIGMEGGYQGPHEKERVIELMGLAAAMKPGERRAI